MITLVIESAIRSLALGLIVGFALTVLRPRNPRVHKLAWLTVLAAALGMPFFALIPASTPLVAAADLPVLDVAVVSQLAHDGHPAWQGIGALYVLVSLLFAARFASGLWKTWRIRRDARVVDEPWAEGVDVRVSASLSSPATFASTILLPARFQQWSEEKLKAVVAHERCHVRERDCYILWLARFHACVFWFNPLAWWLLRRLSVLAENVSDDVASETLGDRPAYAELLLELSRRRAPGLAVVAMTRSHLSSRIERLISGAASSSPLSLRQRSLILALSLPAIAFAAVPVGPDPMNDAQHPSATEPSITDWGDVAEMDKHYPVEAAEAGVEGSVLISVTLDRKGRATDTLILGEDPLDMGFGAAASQLAHTMTYSNPTGRPAQLNFRVQFELDED